MLMHSGMSVSGGEWMELIKDLISLCNDKYHRGNATQVVNVNVIIWVTAKAKWFLPFSINHPDDCSNKCHHTQLSMPYTAKGFADDVTLLYFHHPSPNIEVTYTWWEMYRYILADHQSWYMCFNSHWSGTVVKKASFWFKSGWIKNITEGSTRFLWCILGCVDNPPKSVVTSGRLNMVHRHDDHVVLIEFNNSFQSARKHEECVFEKERGTSLPTVATWSGSSWYYSR